jgi:hypothetical protein
MTWYLEWVIPTAGVAAAAVAFAVGRSLVRVRPRQQPAAERSTNPRTDPYVEGGQTEQRAALRRTGHAIGVQIRDPKGQGAEQSGWVVDRSVGGLCLQLDSPLEIGAALLVRPRNAPPGAPWVAIEVRSCLMEGGMWKIGCKFDKTPTWNILMLFG